MVEDILFDPDVDLISKNNAVLPLLSNEAFNFNVNIEIYPNPSEDVLNIKIPDNINIDSIKIYNMLGQLSLEVPFSETINIRSLSSGIHFVKFSTNKGVLHKSLLKK